MPDDSPPKPTNPNDIANLACFPKKPITVTIVRCKDHQPILLFSVSQPTTGQVYTPNTGSNLFRCSLHFRHVRERVIAGVVRRVLFRFRLLSYEQRCEHIRVARRILRPVTS
jgi:hypothetical protein